MIDDHYRNSFTLLQRNAGYYSAAMIKGQKLSEKREEVIDICFSPSIGGKSETVTANMYIKTLHHRTTQAGLFDRSITSPSRKKPFHESRTEFGSQIISDTGTQTQSNKKSSVSTCFSRF